MENMTIEEIIVEKFNEHYEKNFKCIRDVVNKINNADGWEMKFKVLKKLLRTLPRTEFTILSGIYRGEFLVYYSVSNRFSIRTVDFILNNSYIFVNGRYVLTGFKNNVYNGNNIFKNENIYLILHLEKLGGGIVKNQKENLAQLTQDKKENMIKSNQDEYLNYQEDDFIINDDEEPIILEDNFTDEEIEGLLKEFK